MEKISNEDKITTPLHCGLCIKDILDGKVRDQSPRSYQDVQVGYTKQGLQIWCNRHECNILHMNFEGQKHPANITRKGKI